MLLPPVAATGRGQRRTGVVLADRDAGGGIFPVGLVAFAAIIYSMVPGSGGAPSTAKPAASDAAAGSAISQELPSGQDPLKPLCDFLNLSAGRQESSKDRVCSTAVSDSVRPRIRFLIAMVPDPLDSHLAYLFDRAVDAIQHGVQDNGYVLDRFSLPWKKDARTEWHLSPGLPESLLTLSPKLAPKVLHRRTPGLLLFRGTGNAVKAETPQELVAVFLVGESPISGIQREALTDSLKAIAGCGKQFPGLECEVGKTKIVGPYFSGSAESLRNALMVWKEHVTGAAFKILSGSATVDTNLEVLRFGADRFGATVIPDRVLTNQFYKFLRDRLGIEPSKQVALFVEAGTGYGSASDSNSRERENRGSETSDSYGASVRFVIHFPLHVSQLRGAYEKDQALKSGTALNQGPRRVLELPLETADGDPPDIVPSLDSQMASNVADLALAAGIETIRREHVRLVGIVASDPRDVLFLARKIGESGANVSLFTSGADILYAHPDYQRFLRGMLIATPYPLFLPNQKWTDAQGRRIAFTGVSEEGIYNAIALLLSDKPVPPVIEYHAPDCTGANRPPVWITAVGRGGFWPVAFETAYDDHGYVRLAPGAFIACKPPSRSQGPPGFILSFLLVDLLVASFVVLYFLGRSTAWAPRLRRADELFALWPNAQAWNNPEARTVNRTYALTFFLVEFLLLATFMSWFLKSAKYQPDRLIAQTTPALAAVLLICVGWIVVRELFALAASQGAGGPGWGSPIRKAHALAPAASVAALGVFYCYYLVTIWTMAPGEVLTFSARALDLTSTLGPVMPFLLTTLVLLLWAASGLQRAFLLAVHGNHPSPFPTCSSLSGIDSLYWDAVNVVGRPFDRLAALLVPLVVLVPFHRTVSQSYSTIDGTAWSVLFQVLLLSCYFVTLYSFSLFVLIWVRLGRVLRRLAHHPLADAFRRLPPSCTATPWKLWRTVPNLTTLSASVAQLRVVVNLGKGHLNPRVWNRLAPLADSAEARLSETFLQSTKTFSGAVEGQLKVRDVLRQAVTAVTDTLQDAWAKWPTPRDPLGKLGAPGREARDQETSAWVQFTAPTSFCLWDRAAEELVALRISAFVRVIFQHMKNLLSFVFLGILLMLAAISSYPFEPKNSVMALSWCVVLAVVCLITWAFIGMEQDPILSNMGKTEPGKVTLNREFLGPLAIYVLLPLLTLLATQFPAIGDVVFSVFNPTMKSLSH